MIFSNKNVLVAALPSRALAALALLVCALATNVVFAEAEWTLRQEADGVSVYSREVEGSAYPEFRGTTSVAAELNQLMALMDDTPSYKDWMKDSKQAVLISKLSPIERYTYLVNDLPWPLADRDILVHVTIEQDEATREVVVNLNGVETLPADLKSRVPKRKGREPIKSMKGVFRFTPVSETETKAEYQLHIELTGVPASVASGRIEDIPFITLKNMRDVALLPKYKCFKPF